MTTKRIRFIETREFVVELPAEEADEVITSEDICDLADYYERFKRIAHGRLNAHSEGDLTVEEDDPERIPRGWFEPEPIDGTGRESYLWAARTLVADARYELSIGRYREGKCPELDEANHDLGRLEERLRVMALAVDGLGPDHQPLNQGEA